MSISGMSHAEVMLAMNTPEPALVNDVSEPEFLISARNVRIELLPLEPAAAAEPIAVPVESAVTAAPEVAQGDLWKRIRDSFAMNDLNSKLVTYQEKWYAKHPDYVDRMMERARRYLFYITEEVERRGMPSEIALLPMVESAFNPGAYSVASASGIWQFIPSTGKKFGMQQNWWYDGRRDVINATNGALDYLQ
ncbi:MAG: transglycosylase SLT domain-containing protein, partial [Gallionella sp.]